MVFSRTSSNFSRDIPRRSRAYGAGERGRERVRGQGNEEGRETAASGAVGRGQVRAERISNERPSAKRELIQRTALSSTGSRRLSLPPAFNAHPSLAPARTYTAPQRALPRTRTGATLFARKFALAARRASVEKEGARERERSGMTDARGSWQLAE